MWQFFDFFQNGGCPPSWICYARAWTTNTNEEYFGVATAAVADPGLAQWTSEPPPSSPLPDKVNKKTCVMNASKVL